METTAILDLTRHLYKKKEKDKNGKTRIDREKSAPLARRVAEERYSNDNCPTAFFRGVEPRTMDTVEMLMEAIGQGGMIYEPINELGGDEWTLKFCFTTEVQAELRQSGRKDYLAFLLEYYDYEQVVSWSLLAISGVCKMFAMMKQDGHTHGLAVGHSPDMLMLVAWALMGCPTDLFCLDHGDENLPEGEGYRIALMEDGSLRLVEHLTF